MSTKQVKIISTVTGEEKTIQVSRLSAKAGGTLVKRVSKVFQQANSEDSELKKAINGLITLLQQSKTDETNPTLIWQGLIGMLLASDILFQEFLGFLSDALNIEINELEDTELENVIELAIAIKEVNDFKLIKTLLGNFQKGATQKAQKPVPVGKSK